MINRKSWARDALISLLLAAGYMLIFAYNNTPLGAAIGSDNAMYLTMGTALAKGYAPYTEIFDHKGPLLFLLQLLPQAVSGGYSLTAVFIQETLVLFACLMMMRAIAKELDVCPWAAQLIYMAMTCAFMDGGNLTEEYANLPAICAIYLSIRCFGRQEPEDKLFLPAIGMGVCAMAAFMLRANNALPIAALVLVLAVGLLTAQRYVQIGQCAGGFVTGMLAVMIPIVLWLAEKGALHEAWYGAIIHNMMYAESGTGDRFASLFTTNYGHMAIALAAFSCIGAGVIYRKKHRATLAAAMLAAAAAGGLAAFLSRKFYIHYLMLGAPLAAVGGEPDDSLPREAARCGGHSGGLQLHLAVHAGRESQRPAFVRTAGIRPVYAGCADADGGGSAGRTGAFHGVPRRAEVVCGGEGSAVHAVLFPSGDSGAGGSGSDGGDRGGV